LFKKHYLKLLLNAYLKDQLVFTKKTAAFESKQNFQQLIDSVSKTRWIAYAKRPFAGPQQVLEYLGRYTHRVAISNNRIISIDNGRVTFTYQDRQNDNQIGNCLGRTLSGPLWLLAALCDRCHPALFGLRGFTFRLCTR
jgi:hypothetical protein